MSSGLPSHALGVAAATVLRSLIDNPERDTAEDIARESDSDPQDVFQILRDLAGREAHQNAAG